MTPDKYAELHAIENYHRRRLGLTVKPPPDEVEELRVIVRCLRKRLADVLGRQRRWRTIQHEKSSGL